MRGDRVCVGGYTLPDFKSVRLLGSDGRNMPADTRVEIGDVWMLDFGALAEPVAPHVEDVVVQSGRRERRVEDLEALLLDEGSPWSGPLTGIFDGLLRRSSTGKLGVPVDGPQPGGSTGLWIVDTPLRRIGDSDQRERYETAFDGNTVSVPYVGLSPTLAMLPAGTLARVSLARPFLERCWLQISGWYGDPAANDLGRDR